MHPKLRHLATRALSGCLILAGAGSGAGSSAWSARIWQSDDGLPGNNVTGVSQTSEGYIWLATHNGLARFDGARFEEIPLPIPSGRSHPLIRELLLGRGDQLWIALEGGLLVSRSRTAITLFTATNGLPAIRPVALIQDRPGAVWIGYADGTVCRLDSGRVTRFGPKDGLEGVGPCFLTADIEGQVWFAKAGRVGTWRDGKFRVLRTFTERGLGLGLARDGGLWVCAGRELLRYQEGAEPSRRGLLPTPRQNVEPTVVFEDRLGAVWVGTSVAGLFHFDGTNLVHVDTSHEEILSLANDREGNLWVGTGGGGLNRLRPRVVELQTTESGLPSATVRSICEDEAGVMWAVAQTGELTRREGGTWTTVPVKDGWTGARATCVVKDGAGGVWIGTYHGGLLRWRNGQFVSLARSDGLGGDVIRGLLAARNGDLWIALESPACIQRFRQGKFQTFAQPPGSHAARAMAEDTAGNVWFGTQDGFLLRSGEDNLVDETRHTLVPPRPIRCLAALPDGSLWIGYAGAGLGRFRDGKFAPVDTRHGLHDANICALAADDGGGVWCSADHGIFQVRQRELDAVADGRAERVRSVLFGRDEGLASLQASYGYAPGLARSHDGLLWFPMRTGLAVVNPVRTPANRLPPPVQIQRLRIDGQAVDFSDGRICVVPPEHRRLEIDFTALSFVAPENVHFRYRLKGLDEGWTEANSGQRTALFSRLPAGAYEFHVTACNNAGIWNEEGQTLGLVVPPFFWQQWWFRAAGLGVFGLGVAAVVRYVSFRRLRLKLARLEQETTLHRERARIAKDIHDDLGASLTQISLLGKLAQQDLDQPETAREHVQHISLAARQGVKAVDEIVWAVNPRNDSLAHLLEYAGQYAVDFLRAANVRCRVDFPAEIPPRALAGDIRHSLFLLVKEALNNIVKHSHATEVRLRACLEGDRLHLSLNDNGRGFEIAPENALSDGLRNMQQRLAEIGGTCRIQSVPGEGTSVFVELALPPAGRK
jgi:signal transduction histidine kinase/ligand-binding sensor domain-containing protein